MIYCFSFFVLSFPFIVRLTYRTVNDLSAHSEGFVVEGGLFCSVRFRNFPGLGPVARKRRRCVGIARTASHLVERGWSRHFVPSLIFFLACCVFRYVIYLLETCLRSAVDRVISKTHCYFFVSFCDVSCTGGPDSIVWACRIRQVSVRYGFGMCALRLVNFWSLVSRFVYLPIWLLRTWYPYSLFSRNFRFLISS